MSVLKLARSAPPPLSEARTKLAEAIADLKAAEDRLNGINAALDGASKISWSALSEADAAVTAARENLETTRIAASDFLCRDALGKAEGEQPNLAAARAAVTAAEDRVAAIRGAREALGNELQPAKDAVERCGRYVDSAASHVVREETSDAVAAALEDIEVLQRRYVALQLALDTVLAESNSRTLGANGDPRLTEIANRAMQPLYAWRLAQLRGATDASPSRTTVKAAIEALKKDPTARLPEAL